MLKFQVGGGKGSPSREKMRKATKNGEDDGMLRLVKLIRNPGEEFGFALRGGYEHNIGFFISEVGTGSIAQKCGLQVGDEVVRINGMSLEQIVMPDLIRLVKHRDSLVLRVRDAGKLPEKSFQSSELKWSNVSEFTSDLLNVVPLDDYLSERPWHQEMSSPASSSMSSEPCDSIIPEQPDLPAPSPPQATSEHINVNYKKKYSKRQSENGLERKESSGGYSNSSSDAASTSAFDDSRSDTTSTDGSEKHKSDNSDIRTQLQNELSIKLMAQRRKVENGSEDVPKKASPVKPLRHNVTSPREQPLLSDRLNKMVKPESEQEQSHKSRNRNTPRSRSHSRSNSRHENSLTNELLQKLELQNGNNLTANDKPPPLPQKLKNTDRSILKQPAPAVPKIGNAVDVASAKPRETPPVAPPRVALREQMNLSALKDVSSALNKMHENCDPNVLFTQDQLKGRRVEVVNIGKNLLSRAMLVNNGRAFLKLQEQNGVPIKNMEEILMAEGVALSGCTESQILKMLEKFSHKDIVKLIVAKNN